jgi:hypothetical protein
MPGPYKAPKCGHADRAQRQGEGREVATLQIAREAYTLVQGQWRVVLGVAQQLPA